MSFSVRTKNVEKSYVSGYLGLPFSEYQSLTLKIDSVIHCAALTKHYGHQEDFYSANVDVLYHFRMGYKWSAG